MANERKLTEFMSTVQYQNILIINVVTTHSNACLTLRRSIILWNMLLRCLVVICSFCFNDISFYSYNRWQMSTPDKTPVRPPPLPVSSLTEDSDHDQYVVKYI